MQPASQTAMVCSSLSHLAMPQSRQIVCHIRSNTTGFQRSTVTQINAISLATKNICDSKKDTIIAMNCNTQSDCGLLRFASCAIHDIWQQSNPLAITKAEVLIQNGLSYALLQFAKRYNSEFNQPIFFANKQSVWHCNGHREPMKIAKIKKNRTLLFARKRVSLHWVVHVVVLPCERNRKLPCGFNRNTFFVFHVGQALCFILRRCRDAGRFARKWRASQRQVFLVVLKSWQLEG